MPEQTVEEQIREEIITEKQAPKDGKKPWEARFEADHAELVKPAPKAKAIKAEEPKEEPAAPEVKEEPKETQEEPQPTSEQPAKEETQPAPAQPVETEVKPAEANPDPAKEEAYLAAYANKHAIPIEAAKEEIARNKAILEKYKNDPMEVAKAYHLSQVEFNKLKAESQKQAQTADPVIQQIMANPKGYVENFVKVNSAKLIEEFRRDNPAKSRDMDDEQITEELRDRGLGILQARMTTYQSDLKINASRKREEFLSSIPEADRSFIPEIRTVLDKLPDHQVAAPNFEFKDLIRWAKGGADIDKVKRAEFDRGYKAGLEKAKILGEVGQPSPAGKAKQRPSAQAGNDMTAYQKDQARQMFGNVYDNDDDIFKAYKEVTQSRKK